MKLKLNKRPDKSKLYGVWCLYSKYILIYFMSKLWGGTLGTVKVRFVLSIFFCLYSEVATRGSLKKGVLGNFAKRTGKHLCLSLFSNKPAFLLKKRLWHSCFPVNFEIFFEHFFYRAPPVADSVCMLLFSQKISWNVANLDTMCKY